MQNTLFDLPPSEKQTITLAKEYRVLTLREMPDPQSLSMLDTPEKVAAYHKEFIATDARYNGDVESFYVLMLNTRRRCIGHVLISSGTIDTLLVHPSNTYRAAVIANAAAIICVHNHPSGDNTPSGADVAVTKQLLQAGIIMKVELLDHVIIGFNGGFSLRANGFFS